MPVLGLLMVLGIILAACGGKVPEADPAQSALGTSAVTQGQEVTDPVPSEEEPFRGRVGQDWYVFDMPLFEEVGGVIDLAYGAGRYWAVGRQRGNWDEGFLTPALLMSSDGLHWEKVDLVALGLPEDLSGEGRLLGTEEALILVFQNQDGKDSQGDRPQRLPWILVGDGETWQLTGEEAFGSWQVLDRGSKKYLKYWGLEAFFPFRGEIVLMPSIGWFEAYSTSDMSLALGHVGKDGQGALVADFDALRSPYYQQMAKKMLEDQGDLLSFLSSYQSRQEGGGLVFNLWRSEDGIRWTHEIPDLGEDPPPYVYINDVIRGPSGLVAVGWQADEEEGDAGTSSPIAFHSEDSRVWTYSLFGQEWEERFQLAATGDAYFAYGEGNQVWTSLDGKVWEQVEPQHHYFQKGQGTWELRPSGGVNRIMKAIGFPGGLIALGGNMGQSGTQLLLTGDLPFPYLELD